MLYVRIRLSIANYHRLKVDLHCILVRYHRKLLVFLMNYAREVRDISAPIRLSSEMERRVGVFRVALKEQLKEGIHVFTSEGARAHLRAIVGVGISHIDGLVEENNIRLGCPTVRVIRDILALVLDAAGTELEEETS